MDVNCSLMVPCQMQSGLLACCASVVPQPLALAFPLLLVLLNTMFTFERLVSHPFPRETGKVVKANGVKLVDVPTPPHLQLFVGLQPLFEFIDS